MVKQGKALQLKSARLFFVVKKYPTPLSPFSTRILFSRALILSVIFLLCFVFIFLAKYPSNSVKETVPQNTSF